jgi:hypothetical protein
MRQDGAGKIYAIFTHFECWLVGIARQKTGAVGQKSRAKKRPGSGPPGLEFALEAPLDEGGFRAS